MYTNTNTFMSINTNKKVMGVGKVVGDTFWVGDKGEGTTNVIQCYIGNGGSHGMMGRMGVMGMIGVTRGCHEEMYRRRVLVMWGRKGLVLPERGRGWDDDTASVVGRR